MVVAQDRMRHDIKRTIGTLVAVRQGHADAVHLDVAWVLGPKGVGCADYWTRYSDVRAWGCSKTTFVCQTVEGEYRFVPRVPRIRALWKATRTSNRRARLAEMEVAMTHAVALHAEATGHMSYEQARRSVSKGRERGVTAR